MSISKITLEAWAALKFDPPPSIGTLRRWARAAKIQPQPSKIGRLYMVSPDAEYYPGTERLELNRILDESTPFTLSDRAKRVFNHGQEAKYG
jgi:hypothetical protein